ncbi:MAG: 50S ribosomal protein L18 [bacterium]
MDVKEKKLARDRRHKRVRKRVYGSSEVPRLCVYKSLRYIYAHLIDDDRGYILLTVSTLSKELKEKIKKTGNKDSAKEVGLLLAERAIKSGIKRVVFDRAGYKYHGRVKALADGAREGGLQF